MADDIPPMNGTELRACLDAIGWSQNQLAAFLDVDERTVRLQWAVDRKPPPPNVAAWLRRLRDSHDRNFLPEGWGTNPLRGQRRTVAA